MSEPSLILLISENPANVEPVRGALESNAQQFLLQHVERARTAAARIAGGGVALVLVDISGTAELRRQGGFGALRAAAGELPIVVLGEADDEGLAAQMVQQGAVSYVLRPNWHRDLEKCVVAGMARQQLPPMRRDRRGENRGKVVTVVGAKGGVGATTVATNVAAALASTEKVILAELRPPFGSLCQFFRPHRATRTLHNVLARDIDKADLADVESCLWPNRSIPGLSVLFAPDKALSPEEMGADAARQILRRLSELCEVVVVDLSQSLSDANQAILAESDTLAFVVERDALSVDAAKAKLSALEAAGVVPQEAGLVIVNRVPLAAPLALSDIESQLGLPTFAVIPPAADLCAAGYRVHIPVVKLDAESSLATSLLNLAKRFSSTAVGPGVLRS